MPQNMPRLYNMEASSKPSRFRPSVGAIVFNREGKVLCGKRIDLGFWQFPQGGMHPEEDPVEAALREVKEEVGIDSNELKLVEYRQLPLEKFIYDRTIVKDGTKFDGQEQKYIIFGLQKDISPKSLNLESSLEPAEFSEVDFLTWDQLISRSIPSRTFIYARLRNTVKPMIADYLSKDNNKTQRNVISSTLYDEPLQYLGQRISYPTSKPPPLTYFTMSNIIPENQFC